MRSVSWNGPFDTVGHRHRCAGLLELGPPPMEFSAPHSDFVTTRWTAVLTAGEESPEGREALAQLCARYWYPLYAYVRRKGHSSPDAEDLTQEFFARLLEKRWLSEVRRDGGRF